MSYYAILQSIFHKSSPDRKGMGREQKVPTLLRVTVTSGRAQAASATTADNANAVTRSSLQDAMQIQLLSFSVLDFSPKNKEKNTMLYDGVN